MTWLIGWTLLVVSGYFDINTSASPKPLWQAMKLKVCNSVRVGLVNTEVGSLHTRLIGDRLQFATALQATSRFPGQHISEDQHQ